MITRSQGPNKPLVIFWRNQADSAAYEAARTQRLFNAQSPARYPLAIAFVKTQSEVADTVKLAIEKNCRLSVRAGGHSYASWSVRDEAILVDLRDLSEGPILDNNTGIAHVSPSMTGNDLVSYLSAKGRFFSPGHCPNVGLGGFLLGGGMGWNCNVRGILCPSCSTFKVIARHILSKKKNWGWACEQVVAVDVVTADGSLVRADTQQNTDLFWAARGAGPAFPGIVTRFHLQTRPAPKQMRSSGYVYPIKHYTTAFNWALKVLTKANPLTRDHIDLGLDPFWLGRWHRDCRYWQLSRGVG